MVFWMDCSEHWKKIWALLSDLNEIVKQRFSIPYAISEWKHIIQFWYLTLKAPITTAADDIHKYFFIVFQRKYDLMFQVNPLQGRGFTWNIKPYFLQKIKVKN